MKRTNFYFPEPMLEELRLMSDSLDIPASELMRRALRVFLDESAQQYAIGGPARMDDYVEKAAKK